MRIELVLIGSYWLGTGRIELEIPGGHRGFDCHRGLYIEKVHTTPQEPLQDGGGTQLQHRVAGLEKRSGRALAKRDLTLSFFVDSLGVRPQLLARIGGELYSVG